MKPRHLTEQQFVALVMRRDTDTVQGDGLGDVAVPPRAMPPAALASQDAPAPLLLALTGQLPSGKNQVQLLFRKGKVLKYPNKTFTNWRSLAHIQIEEQQLPPIRTPTITTPVRLTVEYWPGDERTRDVSGQLDALFHLLVYAKVLKDDGLVHDVTWKRQGLNRKFPKAILTVEVL